MTLPQGISRLLATAAFACVATAAMAAATVVMFVTWVM